MIRELEAQRARWRRRRRQEKMTADAGDDFGLGGIGALADGVEARLMFLPADPEQVSVPLDGAALDWLAAERGAPEGAPQLRRRHSTRAVTDALVAYDNYRDDGRFGDYRAIHSHGGVEAGITRASYTPNDGQVFLLRAIVELAWTTAVLQQQACERWEVKGPMEATLALRRTEGAALGGFAEGWRDHGSGLYDFHRCLEPHVFLRAELETPLDPQAFAFQIGDRVELAFGTVNRRYRANRGPFEGGFDPR